jgi:hypothetical protein
MLGLLAHGHELRRHQRGRHAMHRRERADPLRAHQLANGARRRGEPIGHPILECLADQALHQEEGIADHRRIGAQLEDPRHRRARMPAADRRQDRVLARHVVRGQQAFLRRRHAQDAIDAIEQIGLVRMAGRERRDPRDARTARKVTAELLRHTLAIARHRSGVIRRSVVQSSDSFSFDQR